MKETKKDNRKNQLNSKVGFEKRNEIDTVLVRFNKKKRGLGKTILEEKESEFISLSSFRCANLPL